MTTADRATARIGAWVTGATAVAAALALAMGITTPPRSGSNCREGCLSYPYTDAASFVPRDYLWMYPAALVAVLLVVMAVCLLGRVPPTRRPTVVAGVCFAAMGATMLLVDYAIQLTVVAPSLLAGETASLSLLSQYNPHGVFIGLENIGYATVNLALLLLGIALLRDTSAPARAAGWVFTVAGLGTIAAAVGLGVAYGTDLADRFEVASLVAAWLGLIVGGGLLALAYARTRR